MRYIAAVACLALGLALAGCGEDTGNPHTASDQCKDQVKEQLGAADDAVTFSDEAADDNDPSYLVSGHVRGGGKNLRYSCQVKYAGNSEYDVSDVRVSP